MSGKNTSKKNKLKLLLLAAVFLAPMAAAYILYFSGWRPATVNMSGELADPVRSVADAELVILDNGPIRFSAFQRRWLFLYFGSSECASDCEQALYKMRQVIAAQGRQAHRVQAAMVITDKQALDKLRNRTKDYPDMKVLTGAPADIEKLANEFRTSAGTALSGSHRIYVVDPLGNFVMSYPADTDPSGISKDLKKLLHASQIG